MVDKELIVEISKSLSSELAWLAFQALVIALVFSMCKDFVNSLGLYLKLRMSFWGLNTKIKYNGKVGYIREVNMREVIIHVSDSETLYVPIQKFLSTEKTVYHSMKISGEETDDQS